jgi:hypothetical protein
LSADSKALLIIDCNGWSAGTAYIKMGGYKKQPFSHLIKFLSIQRIFRRVFKDVVRAIGVLRLTRS